MKILLLISLMVSLAFASIGQVTGIKGKATLTRDAKSINLIVGYKLEKKDIIKTADKSKVQVIFDDKTIITIGKKSSLNIEEYLYDTSNPSNSKLKLKFFKGAFKSISGKIGKVAPKRFKLKTKNATIGIRGTILAGNQTRVVCEKGAITVSANGVTQVVPAGMMTTTPAGAPPTPPVAYKAGSISLEDEAEKQEEKEKKSKKSDDKKEKKSAAKKDDKKENKKSESKKSDNKKSTQAKSEDKKDDKKSPAQKSSSSNSGAKEPAPAAEEQAADAPEPVALEIDDTETVAIDVDGVDVGDSVGDATDAAADSTGAAEEGVVNLAIANTKQDEVEVVAELEASGVELGEGAAIINGEVVIDGEVVELNDDGELVIGGEEAEVVDGEIVTPEDADAIAAAEEEAAQIAQEEADAIAAAEEEAARIAQEEADAIAAAEEEAAQIAQEEADAIAAAEEELAGDTEVIFGGGGDGTVYGDVTSIAPDASLVSVTKNITSSGFGYLEYGTWNSDADTYIVGDITPSEIVQSVIGSAQAQTYTGNVQAIETVGGSTSPITGDIALTIDFGAQTVEGGMQVGNWETTGYTDTATPGAGITGTISKYSFDSDVSGTYNGTDPISGVLDGKFYGDAVDNGELGGTFSIVNEANSDSVSGVYGASGASLGAN